MSKKKPERVPAWAYALMIILLWAMEPEKLQAWLISKAVKDKKRIKRILGLVKKLTKELEAICDE